MARILLAKRSVNRARKEVVDLLCSALRQVLPDVLLFDSFFEEVGGRTSSRNVHELHELSLQEETRMRSHDVQELGFACGITELPEARDCFCWNSHSDITSPTKSSPRSADRPRWS